MKMIKKIFYLLVSVLIIGMILNYEQVTKFIVSNFIYNKNLTINITTGKYSKNIDYEFVQITNNFVAKDYQDILNIIYTIMDSGNDSFSFYCDDSYKECLSVIDDLVNNKKNTILSEINNFIHPYNTYKNIIIQTNNFGKVTVILEKQYTKEEIEYIEEQINFFNTEITKNYKTNEDKIKAVHDYIINNTTYHLERAENMNSAEFINSKTHTAYGLLTEKKALCGGYSDLMSIYIHSLDIKNIRISGNKHVWNLVNIEGWKHLDATWNDPVTDTGKEILLHDYFFITTEELLKADPVVHNFNKDLYLEAK